MKNILLLFVFISFANIQAQEINLRTMTKQERTRYVSQEATRALDRHLHSFLKELNGPNTQKPQYYALGMSYSEYQINTDKAISDFNNLYGDIVTDYTVRKNDYTYSISFVSNPRLWKPLLYRVVVLNNGRAIDIKVLDIGYVKTIYNQ